VHPHRIAAALAVAITLALTGTAQAQTPTQALTSLARHTTHGWVDDTKPLPVLEHKLNTGQRIYVTCGTISRLAVRKMQRMGVPARLVGAVTTRPQMNGDDGHVLVEVRLNGRWQVFDLDNNRKPVDSAGHGITIRQFVAQTRRYFVPLANDRKVSWAGVEQYRAHSGWIFASEAGLQRWYDRILGIPTMYTDSRAWVAAASGAKADAARRLGFNVVGSTVFQQLANGPHSNRNLG